MTLTTTSSSTELDDVTDETDPAAPAKRRYFSAESKLAILAEYEGADQGTKGSILRREAIYSSHISEWKRARDAGSLAALNGARPTRSSKAEIAQLTKRNARLERELAKTKAALEIMGKVHALLETLSESAQNEPESRT